MNFYTLELAYMNCSTNIQSNDLKNLNLSFSLGCLKLCIASHYS